MTEAPAESPRAAVGLAGVLGRFGWGLGDQLLSSFTNFMLGALVARAVSPHDFGAFSLAYATYTLSLGAVRAAVCDPLVVRYSAVERTEWREGVRSATGATLAAGAIVGVGCLIVGTALGGTLRILLTILGISLPVLLVQDVWRSAFFAASRGSAAFVNDLVWTIVLFVAFAGLTVTDSSSVSRLTASWAVAGCVATAVGLLQARVVPGGAASLPRWLSRHRDLAPRFSAEFALSAGASSLVIFGVGAVASTAAVGQLRAGQIALGPLYILFLGAAMASVPEGVKLLKQSPARLRHGTGWISFLLAAAAFVWGATVFVMPTRMGRLALGSNWEGADAIVMPLSIGAVGYGVAFGAALGMRSLAAARRSLRTRIIDMSVTVIIVLMGAALSGAQGAAWGYMVVGYMRAANAWWQFSRALREYRVESDPSTEEAATSGKA